MYRIEHPLRTAWYLEGWYTIDIVIVSDINRPLSAIWIVTNFNQSVNVPIPVCDGRVLGYLYS